MSYIVRFTESECGWGTDTWDSEYSTEKEAREAAEEVNSKNTAKIVPNIYTTAQYVGLKIK